MENAFSQRKTLNTPMKIKSISIPLEYISAVPDQD